MTERINQYVSTLKCNVKTINCLPNDISREKIIQIIENTLLRYKIQSYVKVHNDKTYLYQNENYIDTFYRGFEVRLRHKLFKYLTTTNIQNSGYYDENFTEYLEIEFKLPKIYRAFDSEGNFEQIYKIYNIKIKPVKIYTYTTVINVKINDSEYAEITRKTNRLKGVL